MGRSETPCAAGRTWLLSQLCCFPDLTLFVTLDRSHSFSVSLSFLINKVTKLGKMISNTPKNGTESRVIKGSSLVTD